MPNVEFVFDEKKDLENFYYRCNQIPIKDKIPESIKRVCVNKPLNSVEKELKEEIKKITDEEIINLFLITVKKAWSKINKEYFKRLGIITNKRSPSEKFKGTLIQLDTCGYDLKNYSFQFSIRTPISYVLLNTAHEIFHIYFHEYYFKEISKEIGEKRTSDLKEALTVLLNLEFSDLWFPFEDKGYEFHSELRKFIKKTWEKEKNFESLISKCVEHLKN